MQGEYFFFPFGKVKKGSKIIIYGAGDIGKFYASQVIITNYCEILFVADRNYSKINDFPFGINVCSPQDISTTDYDYIIISSASETNLKSILQDCENMGISKNKILGSEKYEIEGEFLASFGTSYGNKIYSRHGDDIVVFQIFKQLGIDKPSYIDIGAHHPSYVSNTAIFHKFGSRGINIDANPNLMKNFYEQRPDDINLNVGIGIRKGVLPFYMFGENHECNTFSLQDAKFFEESCPDMKILKTIELPVTTLTDIIKEHWNGKYPDYMDIDIEGLDYEVLQSCDFSGETPYVICAEINKTDISKMNAMLGEKDFVPYCRMVSDMIYIRKNLRNKLLE